MKTVGKSLVATAYRKLRPWLEAIEREDALQRGTAPVPGMCDLPDFLARLEEETARADRYRRSLAVAVFRVPESSRPEQRRKLEITLRAALRKADISARVSDQLLAAALPETDPRGGAVVERLTRLLSQAAGRPIASGFACYPAEARTAADLIRKATERSSEATALTLLASGAKQK